MEIKKQTVDRLDSSKLSAQQASATVERLHTIMMGVDESRINDEIYELVVELDNICYNLNKSVQQIEYKAFNELDK